MIGWEITFELDIADGVYRFTEGYRRERNTPEGVISPPHELDETITVFVHGTEETTVRAWRIARTAYPDLPFDWVYDDEGNEVHE